MDSASDVFESYQFSLISPFSPEGAEKDEISSIFIKKWKSLS